MPYSKTHIISANFNTKLKVVAAICDIELEIQDVDLLNGEQKQDWYLKINPKAKISQFCLNEYP